MKRTELLRDVDGALAIIDRIEAMIAQAQPLLHRYRVDDDAAYALQETARRYLPDTIEAYLAIPPFRRDRTAKDVFVGQLRLLERATALRLATLAEDAEAALAINGQFLSDRFGPLESLPEAPAIGDVRPPNDAATPLRYWRTLASSTVCRTFKAVVLRRALAAFGRSTRVPLNVALTAYAIGAVCWGYCSAAFANAAGWHALIATASAVVLLAVFGWCRRGHDPVEVFISAVGVAYADYIGIAIVRLQEPGLRFDMWQSPLSLDARGMPEILLNASADYWPIVLVGGIGFALILAVFVALPASWLSRWKPDPAAVAADAPFAALYREQLAASFRHAVRGHSGTEAS